MKKSLVILMAIIASLATSAWAWEEYRPQPLKVLDLSQPVKIATPEVVTPQTNEAKPLSKIGPPKPFVRPGDQVLNEPLVYPAANSPVSFCNITTAGHIWHCANYGSYQVQLVELQQRSVWGVTYLDQPQWQQVIGTADDFVVSVTIDRSRPNGPFWGWDLYYIRVLNGNPTVKLIGSFDQAYGGGSRCERSQLLHRNYVAYDTAYLNEIYGTARVSYVWSELTGSVVASCAIPKTTTGFIEYGSTITVLLYRSSIKFCYLMPTGQQVFYNVPYSGIAFRQQIEFDGPATNQ